MAPVIVGMARTPVGDFLGGLSSLTAVQLATAAAGAALERAGLKPAAVDEVVCGMVYRAGTKGNPARQIQLALGCPESGTASTVDQQCASGMRAFELACQSVVQGDAEVSVAVGAESMSNVPHILPGLRKGARMGDVALQDCLLYDALQDAMLGYHMGLTAETLARRYDISRQEQDELALQSHQRAVKAAAQGLFADDIVPVEVTSRKETRVVEADEHPRADLTLQQLQKLRPAFDKEGTVTAGNASGLNDGAAALVLMREDKARELGAAPLARVLSVTFAGVAPQVMGIGPVKALPKAVGLAGLGTEDIEYYEINEAFAAQFLAVNRELNLPMDRVNANGSGISLGHPVGCTGARILIALARHLQREDIRYGAASLCVGGGPAMAAVLERV